MVELHIVYYREYTYEKIWNKIRKIQGRYRMMKAPVLTDRDTLVADPFLV